MRTFARPLLTLASALLLGAAPAGQGPPPFGPQPASATDLAGYWTNVFHQDAGLGTGGGNLVDYTGIPLNDAGRLYALAWDASRMTVRQQQCPGYVAPYFYFAPQNYRFWEERNQLTQELVAYRMYGQTSEQTRTIWMDGRPRPPKYAPHTWAGFALGRWEGSTLTVETTHLKRAWARVNGVPQSDQATLVEHFMRHGDRITYVSVVTDPVYLEEPWIRSLDFVRNPNDPQAWLYACDDAEQIVGRPDDVIPSYPFGQNPFLREFSEQKKFPLLGALGGADTTHPEFIARLARATDADVLARTRPSATGPQRASVAVDPNPRDGNSHDYLVQGNVHLFIGDASNIAVQVGDQGALVVDTGSGQLADRVIAEIQKISPKPVQFIVNTSFHPDRTGGNVRLRASGRDPSVVGSFFSSQFNDAGVGATIIAQQNVQNRMSAPTGQTAPTPADGWPSDTFVQGRRRKFHNGEAVEIFYLPNASTDGDSIVHFRRSDVIVTGDLFDTTRYPFIDVKNGGSVQGLITALNFILDRTVYRAQEEGGTMIVPGRGRITDEWEVAEYRDMVVLVRDRVQALVTSGATLDQVKAARVTVDFDPRFGATSGPWTTDMFVEAVYTTLKTPPATK
jgi:glyoxylase-like metal-dependent hydrolase (beta-lactamase superfamily II)